MCMLVTSSFHTTRLVSQLLLAELHKRKLLDDFKKPLDDTRALINEFSIKRHVPSLLDVAQADAMKEHLQKLGLAVAHTREIPRRISNAPRPPPIVQCEARVASPPFFAFLGRCPVSAASHLHHHAMAREEVFGNP